MNCYKITLSLVISLLCSQAVLPMEQPRVSILKKQTNCIRKELLTKFVKQESVEKNSIISFVNAATPSLTPPPETLENGDVYLEHAPYELIGTPSGHLLIININDSKKTYPQIKAHSDAISSITAKDDIVATASRTCNSIHRWNISTCKMHDKISCPAPIIFVQNINNLLFSVDTKGNISVFDWESGKPLCSIKTGITQPILNALLDKSDDKDNESIFIIITTEKIRALIKIDLLVNIDKEIYSLNESQIDFLYRIIMKITPKNYTESPLYDTLPNKIKELIT